MLIKLNDVSQYLTFVVFESIFLSINEISSVFTKSQLQKAYLEICKNFGLPSYQSSDVAVSANEEAFKLMTQKFENGKATAIEFNESKLNLMKSVSDRIQAKYEYMFRTKILDFYKGKPIE